MCGCCTSTLREGDLIIYGVHKSCSHARCLRTSSLRNPTPTHQLYQTAQAKILAVFFLSLIPPLARKHVEKNHGQASPKVGSSLAWKVTKAKMFACRALCIVAGQSYAKGVASTMTRMHPAHQLATYTQPPEQQYRRFSSNPFPPPAQERAPTTVAVLCVLSAAGGYEGMEEDR